MGLLNLAEELHNVSQACRVMGVSRDTFYRVREAKESGGLDALLHKNRRRANLRNRVDEVVEAAILAFAVENPAVGQVRVSNELRKKGIIVSPTGVRSVWLRHNLQTFRLRLAALEKKSAEEGLVLTETQVAAADVLNDRVLPFYQEHQVPLLRVLTDRGTEYCGKVEQHDYQLYLAMNDIDHTRTKAQSPQTNGICERFHKTILNEFYQVAFRKKIYTTLESIQEDLDAWIDSYNHERTHQGKMWLWSNADGDVRRRQTNLSGEVDLVT